MDTFRVYINDLSSTLARVHHADDHNSSDADIISTFYRGARLLLAELQKFRANEGKLISINGYSSASCARHVALKFAMDDARRTDSIPILIKIGCQSGERAYPIFADVATFSEFLNEKRSLV